MNFGALVLSFGALGFGSLHLYIGALGMSFGVLGFGSFRLYFGALEKIIPGTSCDCKLPYSQTQFDWNFPV